MSAIGYIRVSTDDQADSGAGLAAQEAAILAECSRRDLAVEIVKDAGYSAKDLKRPALKEALDRLDRGESHNALVVARLDRLSRSVLDFAGLMQRASENGWAIICLDLGIDTTTPNGELLSNVMAAFAQFERKLISERTKAALAAKKAQGVRLGRPVSIPESVLERIRAMRAEGESYKAITDVLNAEGVPTAQGGKQWWPDTVRLAHRRMV